jgi:hypothetical protein
MWQGKGAVTFLKKSNQEIFVNWAGGRETTAIQFY